MCTVGIRKPYIEQAAGDEWDVKNQIGRPQEWAAIQLVVSMWLRKRDDEKKFLEQCGKEKR
jgi:hypothetical protein